MAESHVPPTDEELREWKSAAQDEPWRPGGTGAPHMDRLTGVIDETLRLRAERRRYFIRLAIATRAGVPLGDEVAAEAVRIDALLEREAAILEAERKRAERERALPESVKRLRAASGTFISVDSRSCALVTRDEFDSYDIRYVLEWVRSIDLSTLGAPGTREAIAVAEWAVKEWEQGLCSCCNAWRRTGERHTHGCQVAAYVAAKAPPAAAKPAPARPEERP